MLSKTQIEHYKEIGAIVVPDILTADEVQRLRHVTDEFVERARGVTAHTDIYDLEDSHTADNPRVRRIKAAHLHHPEYAHRWSGTRTGRSIPTPTTTWLPSA
jgi:phytanoyl-CoA hydroxylase